MEFSGNRAIVHDIGELSALGVLMRGFAAFARAELGLSEGTLDDVDRTVEAVDASFGLDEAARQRAHIDGSSTHSFGTPFFGIIGVAVDYIEQQPQQLAAHMTAEELAEVQIYFPPTQDQ